MHADVSFARVCLPSPPVAIKDQSRSCINNRDHVRHYAPFNNKSSTFRSRLEITDPSPLRNRIVEINWKFEDSSCDVAINCNELIICDLFKRVVLLFKSQIPNEKWKYQKLDRE